jgi:photosystem II stability/assembly factor-like uncharacterized protein
MLQDTGFIVGYNYLPDTGIILRTTDGGATWHKVYNGLFEDFYSVYFVDNNTGYATSFNSNDYFGYIFKTIDGGNSWVRNNVSADYLGDVFFTDIYTGYIAGAGKIFKTTDGGLSWSYFSGDFMLESIEFINADTGFAVGTNQNSANYILKTSDGGATWVTCYSGSGEGLSSVTFPELNTGYACGLNGIILKTTDFGETWSKLESNTEYNLLSVCFPDSNTGYVAGEYGTILKTTTGGVVGVSGLPIINSKLKIYPNPVNDRITVESSGNGYFAVFNISGQPIIQQEMNALSVTIDVGQLNSGIYLVKFTGKHEVRVGKFIKL